MNASLRISSEVSSADLNRRTRSVLWLLLSGAICLVPEGPLLAGESERASSARSGFDAQTGNRTARKAVTGSASMAVAETSAVDVRRHR